MADEPWQVLAELVRRRREERRISQRELAMAAGTTDRLISSIERAERTNYTAARLRAVSAALGWTADSIHDVLAGRGPTDATHQVVGDPYEQRLATLEAELRDLREQLGLPPRQRNGDDETRSA